MWIQPHQFHEIFSPKKACQRGLEEYITQAEQGDKQIYHPPYHENKPAYLFFNNPVYRVGSEGDPAPGGLSSRAFAPKLKPTESPVHLLYPTIDSGDVFYEQKPWDLRWQSSRINIPNVSATSEEINDQNQKMSLYDDSITERLAAQDYKDRHDRLVPIYDQQRISDEDNNPDGVHTREYPPGYNQGYNWRPVEKDGVPAVVSSGGPALPIPLDSIPNTNPRVIEGYTSVKSVNPSSSSTRNKRFGDLGYYGYPQPSGYATVGDNPSQYDIFPKHLIEKYVNNLDGTENGNNLANKLWFVVIMAIILVIIVIILAYAF